MIDNRTIPPGPHLGQHVAMSIGGLAVAGGAGTWLGLRTDNGGLLGRTAKTTSTKGVDAELVELASHYQAGAAPKLESEELTTKLAEHVAAHAGPGRAIGNFALLGVTLLAGTACVIGSIQGFNDIFGSSFTPPGANTPPTKTKVGGHTVTVPNMTT